VVASANAQQRRQPLAQNGSLAAGPRQTMIWYFD